MSVVAPPERPRPDELDLLIREARARQLRRRLGAVAVVAVLLGTTVAIYAILAVGPRGTTGRPSPGRTAGLSSSRCGVRVRGPNIFREGQLVFRDRVASPMSHEIRCSGSTVWAVFFNGIGTNVESYVGVRSGDAGHTWRVEFGQNYKGVGLRRDLGPELGTWTLSGSRGAFFIGLCGPCQVSSGRWGTVVLAVTKDGGRTFRRYPVPALAGFPPRRLRVTGHVVTIWGRQLTKPYTHKIVRLHVA